MKAELKGWVAKRVNILKQLTVGFLPSSFCTHSALFASRVVIAPLIPSIACPFFLWQAAEGKEEL